MKTTTLHALAAAALAAALGTPAAAQPQPQRPAKPTRAPQQASIEDQAVKHLDAVSVAIQTARLNSEALVSITEEPAVYDQAHAMMFVRNAQSALQQAQVHLEELRPLTRGRYEPAGRTFVQTRQDLERAQADMRRLSQLVGEGRNVDQSREAAKALRASVKSAWDTFKDGARVLEYPTGEIQSR